MDRSLTEHGFLPNSDPLSAFPPDSPLAVLDDASCSEKRRSTSARHSSRSRPGAAAIWPSRVSISCQRASRAYGSREPESMTPQHAEQRGGTQVAHDFGRSQEKGRPVSRHSGRRSGQAKGYRLRHDCRGPEATRDETIAVHRRGKLGTSPQGFTPMGGGLVCGRHSIGSAGGFVARARRQGRSMSQTAEQPEHRVTNRGKATASSTDYCAVPVPAGRSALFLLVCR
jgi:hypothetical protein